ncbi:MAG: CRISPR-associated endoribonuclease Cas6 [Marinilabiliales bacterium]|nr:CRISPR-associated endoribonuclease Cas6 [Marinilabiliales bacterium]
MRYKLTLKLEDPQRNLLPLNYQYELGAWFYKRLNDERTGWHRLVTASRLISPSLPFKTFTFSHLVVPDRAVSGDRLQINSPSVSLVFSTLPDPMLSESVMELFSGNRFLLGDRQSQVAFEIVKTELLPEPVFAEKMTFKTLSPIHLPVKVEGRKNDQYLSPEEPDYVLPFFHSLHKKYLLLEGSEHVHDPSAAKFKLRSKVTLKGITMQAGTPSENKLVGYQLRFRLSADPALLRAGYYLGFGEKNHLGFGCCEIL